MLRETTLQWVWQAGRAPGIDSFADSRASSLLLLGTGFLGLAFLAFRKGRSSGRSPSCLCNRSQMPARGQSWRKHEEVFRYLYSQSQQLLRSRRMPLLIRSISPSPGGAFLQLVTLTGTLIAPGEWNITGATGFDINGQAATIVANPYSREPP